MPTVNERLLDGQIGHQLDLQKYSNGVVRRIMALLNRTDPDLFAQLNAALERLPAESFTVQRLDQLLASVRALNVQAYQSVERELTTVLREFTEYEAGFQLDLFRSTIPPQVVAVVPLNAISVTQVYAAAMSRPFQGRLLSEWAQSMEADRMVRIRDAIRIGYTENQTTAQIVQRIRGTRAKGYEDGLIQIDRRNAEAVVRTAVSHTAATTRQALVDANLDMVKAITWCSTLDGRTSPTCQIRDGKQYTADTHRPIGHKNAWLGGPGMAHWGCRSTSNLVLKSLRELGIPMDDLDPGTRSSMDGQVPADVNFPEWLKKQSAARQNEVLGPTRAKEFRAGKPFDRFFNDKGSLLTLDEMRAQDARRREAVAA
jgi:hypothetical protein